MLLLRFLDRNELIEKSVTETGCDEIMVMLAHFEVYT